MYSKCTISVICSAITLFLLGVHDQSFAQECTVHGSVRELTDVGRRSPLYFINSSTEPTITDSTLPTGWYVADDNVRYYTMVYGTAPRFGYCGTDYPIYIKDNITEVDEGKEYDYTACLVHYDSDCKLKYNVTIRKCGREIQYYLRPTDGISAYCFEPSSVAVEPAPNYRIPGSIKVSVALMYTNTSTKYEPELDFKCNFGSASKSYYYEVNWVINGRVEETFTRVKVKDVDSTNLNENTLRSRNFSLGISIQCGVRISSSLTGRQTSPQMSDIFYAGVKIQNPWMTLETGDSADIILQPTVPLGCRSFHQLPNRIESCSVYFEMFDPNSNYMCEESIVASISLSNQKLCGSRMDGWRNTDAFECMNKHNVDNCSYSRISSVLKQQTISVIVANDEIEDKYDKTFTLQLKTGALGPHSFWENSRLDDVQILYRGNKTNLEWRNNQCHVVNDPFLKTFDGQSEYLRQFGTYLLYKNSQYDSEVQIKTQHCYADSTASCACAAAIKAGGDVFVIDICIQVKRASFKHCQTDLLNVREIASNDYEIYFPTGTKVKVQMGTWNASNFLKVFVYPSSLDTENTEGLCGNFNGNKDEMLTDSYFSNWSLQETFFESLIDLPSDWTYQHSVCICPRADQSLSHPSISPNEKDPRARCFNEKYAVCTDNIILKGEKKDCKISNKRSVERHQRNLHRLSSMSQLQERPNHRNRRSTAKSSISEKEAYRECISLFQSKPVYNMRNDLPSISLNDSVASCVNDIMIDGQEFWKEESYNSWVTIISQEIGRNQTFRKENENVVRDFKNVSCLAQCNGNGDCINGTCICRNDFVGDSCFIKKSTPLELTDIEGGGECDLAYGEDCHECLQFHTVNLLKGFKCKIKTQELDENGTIIISDEIKRVGEYENIFEGYCCPSAVEERRKRSVTTDAFIVKYTISVSNDGINFGTGRNVYVYDSTCQKYVMMENGDWKFSLKNDTCYINEGCYRHGDESMMNPNLICCPLQATYTWSTVQGCYGHENQAENHTITIVAVAVSVTVILIAVLVAVFAVRIYKGKMVPVQKSEPEPDYTKLHFQGKPGTPQFQQLNPNVLGTDYEQLKI